MIKVSSSAIAAIGYSELSQTLKIRFKSGEIYVYAGVSDDVYRAFLNAPSKGTYFSINIRDQYAFRHVR